MATTQQPFSIENRVELEALCNMLHLAGGFTLGFARVNHAGLRERLVAEVKQGLAGKLIVEMSLERDSSRGVVTQLDDALRGHQPDVVFAYGLEGMFDLGLAQSPAMDILNLNRDFFARQFPWPVVFWVPEFAMREVGRQAPDFWAWRSGTYHFVGEEGDIAETLVGLEQGRWESLSLCEKRERREILAHLLAEIEAKSRCDSEPTAKALFLIGQAEYHEDKYGEAHEHLRVCLATLPPNRRSSGRGQLRQ